MAVQKKSNAGDKPEEKKINWMQVGVVGFCILIVVMCILSFSNFQNFFGGNGSSGAVETGDVVAVEYLMYVGDTPVFTSLGGFVAGYENNQSAYVPIDNSTKPYMVLASEQNAISLGVIGMNLNEEKTVDGSGTQAYTYTKAQVTEMGVDFDSMKLGDMLQLDFPYVDELGESATAVRTGVITELDAEKVTIQYGSDKIEIRFAGYLSA